MDRSCQLTTVRNRLWRPVQIMRTMDTGASLEAELVDLLSDPVSCWGCVLREGAPYFGRRLAGGEGRRGRQDRKRAGRLTCCSHVLDLLQVGTEN
jgi:hypothetical protein